MDYLYCRKNRADRRNAVHAPDLANRVGKVVRNTGHRNLALVVDVVVTFGTYAVRHEVEVELMPSAPGDVVIGTGCVVADPDSADQIVMNCPAVHASSRDDVQKRAVGWRRMVDHEHSVP